MSQPTTSIVLVEYNMAREIPRTVLSLSPAMQRGMMSDDYEIIVIDNGSPIPIPHERLATLSSNVRFHRMDSPKPSPAAAVNVGLSLAKGNLIGVWIDGARLASPGIVASAMHAAQLHPRPVVATLGFHLGPEVQMKSIHNGYNQQVEDDLLNGIRWQEDGYRLFDISALAGSSANGWFNNPSETNALFMSRALWEELGGYDEKFRFPGGGLVNLDTFSRACALDNSQLIMLLGEATFHQIHGGIATNAAVSRWHDYHDEYVKIRGRAFTKPSVDTWYFGSVPQQALRWLELSASLARR